MAVLDGVERRALLTLLAAAPLLGASSAFAADAPGGQYVVTYIEAPPAQAAAVQRKLNAYAAALRAGAPSPSVDVLSEIGRPQRMAVIERWQAVDAPADGVLQRDLDGMLQAPVDRRLHRAIGALQNPAPSGAFHMLMHVDVVPAGAEMANKLLDSHRAAVMAAKGALAYEVAVQTDRANHFAVHQTWASRAAYEAYAAGPGAQDLRKQLATVKGALFDDRFYVAAKAPR
jgi:quinol monooxygenase YgiN